jgi:crotonobetainyl-CoA:carnitine CoA-transferase CaiB-like acyl-CoA transferase
MVGRGGDPVAEELDALLTGLARLPASVVSPSDTEALARHVPADDDVAHWARSGAMALTGGRDGPPQAAVAPVASRVAAAGALLRELSAVTGRRLDVDVPALLGERAALRGLHRAGAVSVGGSSRLLRARDGWLAVSLARPDDWSLVPAWLRSDVDDWCGVTTAVGEASTVELSARGGELGLPVAAAAPATGPGDEQYLARHAHRTPTPWLVHPSAADPRQRRAPLRVVDLSALWAGPLCAHLLGLTGAEVVTVEDPRRTDGARRGDPALHRLLHAGHEHAAVRLDTDDGRGRLHGLLARADVVISSARPRALRQLGIDPVTTVAANPGMTWVAITGYGLAGPWSQRIAYGDDAAVAGGLVAAGPTPLFCADAVADPATGIYAAVAALAVTRSGGGVIDIALRDVAAHLARSPHDETPRAASRDEHGWFVPSDSGPVRVAAPRARVGAR